MINFFDGLLVDWLIELVSNLIESVCGFVPDLFVDGILMKGLAVLIYLLVDKMYSWLIDWLIIWLLGWMGKWMIECLVYENIN